MLAETKPETTMRTNTNLTPATRNAVRKYGERRCLEAWELCDQRGEGGRTVGYYMGVTTNTADAMIFAGRELITGKRQ